MLRGAEGEGHSAHAQRYPRPPKFTERGSGGVLRGGGLRGSPTQEDPCPAPSQDGGVTEPSAPSPRQDSPWFRSEMGPAAILAQQRLQRAAALPTATALPAHTGSDATKGRGPPLRPSFAREEDFA